MPSKKGKSRKGNQSTNTKAPTTSEVENNTALQHALSPRSATGVLSSLPKARDIHITNFSLSLLGTVLVDDTELHLNYGQRYGLIGLNGCGKSSLLKCIAEREVPIPEHINIYHVDREVAASDKTAMETVIEDVEAERQRLEAEAEELAVQEDDVSQETLNAIYESLDLLEPDTIQKRAGEILYGLGFTKEMQNKKCKEYSGGWRMRISLAKALFMRPVLLLLDDATNHLGE
jgi:ATP-binding cassette subfamily F protein 2